MIYWLERSRVMAKITGYNQFGGSHWETGALCNVLAYKRVVAPHTGEPFSEAMLMGIGGGVGVMYFLFEYEGYEPHLYIGTCPGEGYTRIGTICERLGVKANIQETTSRDKAAVSLNAALEAGDPAIVWADMFRLRYNVLPAIGFPGMMPVVVYGYDKVDDIVCIDDRAHVPLTSTTVELAEARAAQGSIKHKLITLEPSAHPINLPSAIVAGIHDCVKGYIEGPGKGPRTNFGLAALLKWADMMTNTKDKKGWPTVFARGANLYSGLLWAYQMIETWGAGSASRPMYAEFLVETSSVLGKTDLNHIADQFRASGARWSELSAELLPDGVPQLRETRELILQKHKLFSEQGMAALGELQSIEESLAALKREVSSDFPMTDEEVVKFREVIRERILRVHEAEHDAIMALREVMANQTSGR
jgi:hypothetical protein